MAAQSSGAAPSGAPVSKPRFEQIAVTHDLRVPMRDGVDLALDLLRPDTEEPLPTVLVRTPYDKTLTRATSAELFDSLARRGYVVAVNDCRGRFNSDGEFFPFVHEQADGYDAVEWIASQAWCDGSVGMVGASYVGQTQWFAASEAPPHLKAIVPLVAPPASPWRNEPVQNGVFRTCFAEWLVAMGRRAWQIADWPPKAYSEQQTYFEAIPFAAADEGAGVQSSWWREMTAHPVYGDFWRTAAYGPHDRIRVPALNVTGWWDLNFPGAPENFEAVRREGATEEARQGQKLVIGPWPHRVNQTSVLNGIDFGEEGVIQLNEYVIRFFDRWLKGLENGIDEEPPVHVFVTGLNRWRAEPDWPLPGTELVPFYLRSGGAANSLLGDGTLSTQPPLEEEPPDRYDYDPEAVERTLWSLHEGPVDDRVASARDDVLCYTTEPLSEPLEVIGWVSCRLFAASSARDTDWHARLVDVHPDGSARFLCHGVLRARFRDSWEEPKLLEPGRPTEFEFTMDATGVRFLPGHRIRVEITSSWFTQFERNLNDGADNPFRSDHPVVAHQSVFHRPDLASCVLLPIVPPIRADA